MNDLSPGLNDALVSAFWSDIRAHWEVAGCRWQAQRDHLPRVLLGTRSQVSIFFTSLRCSPEILKTYFEHIISNYHVVLHVFAHFCSLSPYRCLVGSSSENVRGHAAGQAPVVNPFLHSFSRFENLRNSKWNGMNVLWKWFELGTPSNAFLCLTCRQNSHAQSGWGEIPCTKPIATVWHDPTVLCFFFCAAKAFFTFRILSPSPHSKNLSIHYCSFKNPSLEVWYRTYVKSSAAIPSLLWFQIRFRYTVYICITYIYCTFVYYAKPTLFGCQLCVEVLLILLFTCRLAKFGRWHDAILLHLGARQASAT